MFEWKSLIFDKIILFYLINIYLLLINNEWNIINFVWVIFRFLCLYCVNLNKIIYLNCLFFNFFFDIKVD